MMTILIGTLGFQKRGEEFFVLHRINPVLHSFVCAQKLQDNVSKKCEDFEVRFCCKKKLNSSVSFPDPNEEPFFADEYRKMMNDLLPKNISVLRKLNRKSYLAIIIKSIKLNKT